MSLCYAVIYHNARLGPIGYEIGAFDTFQEALYAAVDQGAIAPKVEMVDASVIILSVVSDPDGRIRIERCHESAPAS